MISNLATERRTAFVSRNSESLAELVMKLETVEAIELVSRCDRKEVQDMTTTMELKPLVRE